MEKNSHLSKKKILVTGADGFIGSHLAEMLVSEGSSVRALIQYNSLSHWGWLDNSPLAKDMEIVLGDVRDAQICREITTGIDTVFHLAALIGIPYSYHAVQSYVDTNISGTLNICAAALEAKCSKILVTSTSEVYGSALQVPMNEAHPLQAQSPYSATKIGADAIAMSFFYSWSLPLTLVRPFNTYGPRQSARAVIPNMITQILEGKKMISLGDISTKRDFTFVKDTCQAMISLSNESLNGEALGKVVNIGTNFETSIKEVFHLICDIMGSKAEMQFEEARKRPQSSEVTRLWCDNSQLKKLTGFVPLHNLRDGLIKTIEWFSKKENLSRYKGDLYHV